MVVLCVHVRAAGKKGSGHVPETVQCRLVQSCPTFVIRYVWVRPFGDQKAAYVRESRRKRLVQGSCTTVPPCVDVRAMANQQLHDAQMTRLGREVQGGVPIPVPGLDIEALCQKQPHAVHVTCLSSLVESGCSAQVVAGWSAGPAWTPLTPRAKEYKDRNYGQEATSSHFVLPCMDVWDVSQQTSDIVARFLEPHEVS